MLYMRIEGLHTIYDFNSITAIVIVIFYQDDFFILVKDYNILGMETGHR